MTTKLGRPVDLRRDHVLRSSESDMTLGPAFDSWWSTPLGVQLGGGAFTLPILNWINDGLLGIFFLVVGQVFEVTADISASWLRQ
jgi:Na+/H+ antiporter NhaA